MVKNSTGGKKAKSKSNKKEKKNWKKGNKYKEIYNQKTIRLKEALIEKQKSKHNKSTQN